MQVKDPDSVYKVASDHGRQQMSTCSLHIQCAHMCTYIHVNTHTDMHTTHTYTCKKVSRIILVCIFFFFFSLYRGYLLIKFSYTDIF